MKRAEIISEKKLKSLGEALRREGKRIVFTAGAYDLVHSGQAHFLAEARTWGDILAVGVSSDASRRALRGVGHPLVGEKERAKTLSFLRPVDFVVVVNERDLLSALSHLKPHIFYTIKDDWEAKVRRKEEEEILREYGGKVIKAKRFEPFISSSGVIEKLAQETIARHLRQFLGEEILNHKEEAPYIDLGQQMPRDLLSYAYLGKLIPWKSLRVLGQNLRREGRKIAFVSGSYDLVHVGHVRFIERARSWGDTLVVGVSSDKAIRQLKGPGRPIVNETSRAEFLRFLRAVDFVTILPQKTVIQALKLLKPDVFQTVTEDWNKAYQESEEYKAVKSYGGEVKLVPRQAPFVSSHILINRAAGLQIQRIFKKCLEAVEEKDEQRA